MIAHFKQLEKKKSIIDFLNRIIGREKEIVVFCVGTDRCTGDSLGPLIGHKLKKIEDGRVKIYGDLENPIHARNINQKIKEIEENHPQAFIIAVDATLGCEKDIGYIFVKQGPLDPGSAFSKGLGKIGHMHIGGIVNKMGDNAMESLQNTRLYNIMKMADYIVDIVSGALEK